ELEKIAQEFSWSSSSEEDPFHASEEDSDFIPSENEESQEAHVRDDLLETDGEDGDAEDGDVEDDDLEDNVEAEDLAEKQQASIMRVLRKGGFLGILLDSAVLPVFSTTLFSSDRILLKQGKKVFPVFDKNESSHEIKS
ncbi:unnamed protein product, partial [Acanthoscelides obtectus]